MNHGAVWWRAVLYGYGPGRNAAWGIKLRLEWHEDSLKLLHHR